MNTDFEVNNMKFIAGNEYKLIRRVGRATKDHIQTITIIRRTRCYIWWKGVYDGNNWNNKYIHQEEKGRCKIRTDDNNTEYIDIHDTGTLLMECYEDYMMTMGRYLPSYIFITPEEDEVCNAGAI